MKEINDKEIFQNYYLKLKVIKYNFAYFLKNEKETD